MMARRSAIPVGMRRVYGRFERWRKSHTGRLRIPALSLSNKHLFLERFQSSCI
jgi:hypothetical protein